MTEDTQRRDCEEIAIATEPETGVGQAQAIETKAIWPFPRLGEGKKATPKAARERDSVSTAASSVYPQCCKRVNSCVYI